ncbi:MAG: L,D-transpeptidase [Acidobacteriota bacterium]
MPRLRQFLRLFSWILLLAAVWFASARIVPLVDGSQDLPADSLGRGAQRFLDEARTSGAQRIYPQRYQSAKDALKRARFEMNLQAAGYWGTRDFARAQKSMDEAQRKAFLLWRDTAAHQTRMHKEAARLIAEARESLDSSLDLVEASLPVVSTRSHIADAEMHLKKAQTYLAAARYDEAAAEARASKSSSDHAHTRSKLSLSRFSDPGNVNRWRGWIRQAVEASKGPAGIAMVVNKEHHVLHVYKAGRLVRTVQVDLGAKSINQKMHAGDRATPEGLYRVVKKKGHGQSKFGLALLLNYPNDEDRRRFAELKARGQLTRRTGIGGLIEIHGQGGLGYDWTDGCVAPDDRDMAVLYNETPLNTVVAIVGSDGGDGPIRSMLRRAESYR